MWTRKRACSKGAFVSAIRPQIGFRRLSSPSTRQILPGTASQGAGSSRCRERGNRIETGGAAGRQITEDEPDAA